MKVIIDNLVLCADCTQAAVNNDFTGLDYHYNDFESEQRYLEIMAGLKELGPRLVPSDDSYGSEYDEFSTRQCNCCKTKLAGYRHYFSILGE